MQSKLHRITINAMLAALFVGLSYLAADLGVIKFTFAPIAIILAGFLFGPADGFAVALVGATLEQLLKYGVSITLPLWVIPALVRGLLVGFGARLFRRAMSESKKKNLIFTALITLVSSLVVTTLNTPVLYFDAWLFDYLQYTEVFGLALFWRYVSGIVCSVFYTALTLLILTPVARALRARGKDVLWQGAAE